MEFRKKNKVERKKMNSESTEEKRRMKRNTHFTILTSIKRLSEHCHKSSFLSVVPSNSFSVLMSIAEKASNLSDMASNAAQSTKETMQQAGQQMMATAQGAAEAVKNATGMNK
ncbi:hypothetical protein PIB30_041396 [Stylosanthes scabra]|uniref:Uncharacterized protein n=1 Tax=Stylosanthes scabra TaxID=79078 RepID=A0ABU6SEU6_9FABA|nr:hypothetical protein [Stylosanthes scabra]